MHGNLFYGCGTALVTPFRGGRVDFEALDALIRQTTPESAEANCRALLDYYKTRETGHSAEEVAKYIASKMDRKQERP